MNSGEERMGPSLRRSALAKATVLLGKGSQLAAQHDLGGLSERLARAETRVSQSARAQPYELPEGLPYQPYRSSRLAPPSRSRERSPLPRQSSFVSVRNYLSSSVREYEERCICFPGYAVLRHRQAQTMVEVEASGFVFRTRPLAQANRKQRIFVSFAKQLAGLKSLPNVSQDSLQDKERPLLASATGDFDPRSPTFADELLSLEGATDEEVEAAIKRLNLTEEPEELAQSDSGSTDERLTASTSERPRPSSWATASTDQLSQHSRQSSDSYVSAAPSTGSATSQLATDGDLADLHNNLTERLRIFFSQKLDGRRVRVSVYLLQHPTDELVQCPLLSRDTVISTIGGGFKHITSIPSVHPETGKSLSGATLRVVTELLSGSGDATEGTAPGRIDSAIVKVHDGPIVRVLSDIDDTVKHTQVLRGIRTIFRNVFTLPFNRIFVPGMADWYQAMVQCGVSVHYVSNSPWELSQVVKDFMQTGNLPTGQIKLKEYSGSGGILTDMWSSPAQKKRGNVEDVIKSFEGSKWILVGDSGEQDLELFSTLAAEYPDRVMAIFIRDVTTPLHMKLDEVHRGIQAAMASSDTLPLPKKGLRSKFAPARRKSYPPRIPPARQMSEPASDFLSPNNPLQQTDYTAPRLVTAFYRRIAAAESNLPAGCILRIFRDGSECKDEALALIRELQRELALGMTEQSLFT